MLVGCGSTTGSHRLTQATVPRLPKSHPQVVEPVAGSAPAKTSTSSVGQGQAAEASPGHAPAPTAPASVTGAPAKGAPTDAEVRAAVARFQLAVARYHLNQLDFSGVLLNPTQLPPGVWNVSIASVFTAYGHGVACGGVLRVPELGVANKTLPCRGDIPVRQSRDSRPGDRPGAIHPRSRVGPHGRDGRGTSLPGPRPNPVAPGLRRASG